MPGGYEYIAGNLSGVCVEAGFVAFGGLVAVIIAVSGWRGFTDPSGQVWVASQLYDWETILSQGRMVYWRVGDEPSGVDAIATRVFTDTQLPHCVYHANWDLPNKAGGPVRSHAMLLGKSQHDLFQGRKAHFLLAFPQPGKRLPKHEEVSGTWRAIELAKQAGIPFVCPGYVKSVPEGLF